MGLPYSYYRRNKMPIVIKARDNQEPGAGGGSNRMIDNPSYRGKQNQSKNKTKKKPTYQYGGGTMKMDPEYKSAGGMIYKGR